MNKLVWLWIVLSILLLLVILMITRLHVFIFYIHDADQDYLKLEFRFWKFIKFKKEIPLIAVDKEDLKIKTREKTKVGKNTTKQKKKDYHPSELVDQIKKVKDIINHIFGFHRIVKRFLAKIKVKSFYWETHLGTNDASSTGMLCGALWTIKGGIIGVLSHYMQFKDNPQIYVTPYFQQKISQTKLECMISFRVGQAMYAFFQMARHLQGGLPKTVKKTAH